MSLESQNQIENNGIVNNICFEEMIKEYYSYSSSKQNENNIFTNSILDLFNSSFKKELNLLSSTNNKEEYRNNKFENKNFINENSNTIENPINFSIINNYLSNSDNQILQRIQIYLDEKITQIKNDLLNEINIILTNGNKGKYNLEISHFNFNYYNRECLKNINLTQEKGKLFHQINPKIKKRNYSDSNSSKSDLKNSLQEKNTLIKNYFKKIPKNN